MENNFSPNTPMKIDTEIVKVESENALTKTENLLNILNETGEVLFSSVDRITNTIERVKELNNQIRVIELNFKLKEKDYDLRIEKIKANKAVIQSVLERSSQVVDKLLDKILDMNESDSSPEYVKRRSELMDQLRHSSDGLSLMFISFLKS